MNINIKPSLTILFFLFSSLLLVQCNQTGSHQEDKFSELRKDLDSIISRYKATIGLSVIEIETGDTLTINNKTNFAMQSVYKFPLAIALLNKVEQGKISLQQRVSISNKILNRFSWSALKRQNPGSNLSMSIDSLLMYTIAYSDNISCDVLFESIGGTKVANEFIHQEGFPGIQIKYTEMEIGNNHELMYKNSSTPYEMSHLLKRFFEGKLLNDTNNKLLLNYMTNDSTSSKRLRGKLPSGTIVAHKTGTGYFSDTLVNACNDVGIIYLPNGKHLAVSVFVMNANETPDIAENIIAILTKRIFDFYNQ
jgi:beta-lactamase class A